MWNSAVSSLVVFCLVCQSAFSAQPIGNNAQPSKDLKNEPQIVPSTEQVTAQPSITFEDLPEALRALEKIDQKISREEAAENGIRSEDVIEQMNSTLNRLDKGAVDPLTVTESEVQEAVKVLTEAAKDDQKGDKINAQMKTTLYTKVLIAGHGQAIHDLVDGIIQKLRIPGDSTAYKIMISPSFFPNASITVGSSILTINIGLFAYVKNVDELAAIIAHEMTHDNRDLLKATRDSKEMMEILTALNGYGNLEPSQREELRADLGALYRMIRAGYNPWAFYNLESRLTIWKNTFWDADVTKFIYGRIDNKSLVYFSTHPAGEIRMAAIKAFIMKTSLKRDISEQIKSFQPFSMNLSAFRLRANMITKAIPIMSFWINKAIWISLGYIFTDSIYFSVTGSTIFQKLIYLGVIPDELVSFLRGTLAYGKSIFERYSIVLQTLVSIIVSIATLKEIVNILKQSWLSKDDPFRAFKNKHIERSKMEFQNNLTKLLEDVEKLKSQEDIAELLKSVFTLANRLDFNVSDVGMFDVNPINARQRRKLVRMLDGVYSIVFTEILRQIQMAKTEEEKTTILNSYEIAFAKIPERLLETQKEVLFKIFGLDKITVISFGNEQTDEKDLVSRLLLKKYITLLDKDSPAETRIKLAKAVLRQDGFFKDMRTAVQILGRDPVKLFDFVLTKENKNSKLASDLVFLINTIINSTSFPNQISAYFYELTLLVKLKIAEKKSMADRTALATHFENFNHLHFDGDTIIKHIRSRNSKVLEKFFSENFTSLTQLESYIEHELITRHADLDSLADIFFRVITRHPEWFQTIDDFNSLINKEYFWKKFSIKNHDLNRLNELLSMKVFSKVQDIWKFDVAVAEKFQLMYISGLHKFNLYPTDFNGKRFLWLKLTGRGVTAITDALFQEIYDMANEDAKDTLENLALKGSLVWEFDIKGKIARRKVQNNDSYKKLLIETNPLVRNVLLDEVIKLIKESIPERGTIYLELLEEVSVAINSSREESRIIHEAKTMGLGGEKSEDLALRIFSELGKMYLQWGSRDQWDFILFLRYKIQPTANIQNAFKRIGPERIRRMYQLMPLLARTAFLDTLISSPRGLLDIFHLKNSQTIIDHIFAGQNAQKVTVAKEVLGGFLYALDKTGSPALRTYVLAYLLAQDNKNAEPGQVLKNVLEVFGAAGVKIGQFLAISQILSDEDAKVLLGLQDRAKIPTRESIYSEIESILESEVLPFRLKKLIGSASMKYAVLAEEKSTLKDVVLKIFRLESIAHSRQEFNMLEKMAARLKKIDGLKYGMFNTIVKISRRAIEKEMMISKEPEKGAIAAQKIYANQSEEGIEIEVPKETLVKLRMIVAQYAEGTSFYDLPAQAQSRVSDKILMMEMGNLFSSKDTIYYDPDRHGGNYRVDFQSESKNIKLSPIDFGQLTSITPAQRELVLDLFALAQVAARSGANDWISNVIGTKLKLTQMQTQSLKKRMSNYFPALNSRPVAAYIALLTSMDEAGLEVGIEYLDFIRAIIQLSQFEKFATEKSTSFRPNEKLKDEAKERAKRFLENVQIENNLTNREKMKYLLEANKEKPILEKIKVLGNEMWNRVRSFVNVSENMKIEAESPSLENQSHLIDAKSCKQLFTH